MNFTSLKKHTTFHDKNIPILFFKLKISEMIFLKKVKKTINFLCFFFSESLGHYLMESLDFHEIDFDKRYPPPLPGTPSSQYIVVLHKLYPNLQLLTPAQYMIHIKFQDETF